MNSCAGIVTFNPDITRLNENLSAITKQVESCYIYDNGSKNINDIERLINNFNNVIIIKNEENKGISFALNRLCDKAISEKYSWILLLDQDSVVQDEIIDKYNDQIHVDKVGLITCLIKDRNFSYNNDIKNESSLFEFVDNAITSGSYINLSIFEKIGKFDEIMFIDKVDSEYGFRLEYYGYKLIRVNYVGILHEVGNKTRTLSILGKKVTIFNHSAFRTYYIVRNAVYLSRKYPNRKDSKSIRKSGKHRLLLILLFEKNKFKKIKSGRKGYRDGKRMEVKALL